jgi:hypothetical protein
MSGAIHPLPQYAFMAWCLVKKHRDNFYPIYFWLGREKEEIEDIQKKKKKCDDSTESYSTT